MKTLKFKPFFLFVGLALVLTSCSGDAASGDAEEVEAAVMTTEEFIAAAKEMSPEDFDKKYPRDSEITLEGEVRAPATWDDKVVAKFGTGLNDLPLSADFMFAANGGSKDATKAKIGSGKTVQFTGKVDGSFYMDGVFKRCGFVDCVAK